MSFNETPYGGFSIGNSKVLMIAPHGIDDYGTSYITSELCKLGICSGLINHKLVKPTNTNENNSIIGDLNIVPYDFYKQKYITNIGTERESFLNDISLLVQKTNPLVIVNIHGANLPAGVSIDIGTGDISSYSGNISEYYKSVSYKFKQRNQGHYDFDNMKGYLTVKNSKIYSDSLSKSFSGKISLNKYFCAWYKGHLNQYINYLYPNIDILQLELDSVFRGRKNMSNWNITVDTLAKAILSF